MKSILLQLFAAVAFTISTYAAIQDVEISAVRQSSTPEKTRESSVTVTSKETVFKVTVKSRAFKPLTNIQVKYMIFYEDAQPGSPNKPIEASVSGSETIASLNANQSTQFETSPVKLAKAELDGNFYWASGANGRQRDRITGIWVRAYSGGNLIAEYANPSSTSKKIWKD